MLDVDQFKEYVIKPTLQYLEPEIPYSEEAVNLLIGTAAQESRLTYLHQLGRGPAEGIFQMEPATERDIWNNYLKYKTDLKAKIKKLSGLRELDLTGNLPYQVAMARIKYRRSPYPLPDKYDVEAMGKMWKQVYNTPLGSGTVEEFIRHYPGSKNESEVPNLLRRQAD